MFHVLHDLRESGLSESMSFNPWLTEACVANPRQPKFSPTMGEGAATRQ